MLDYPIDYDVKSSIVEASEAVGVPADLMAKIADRESDFRPNLTNPNSSVGGLFQFIDSTWRRYTSRYAAKYGLDDLSKSNPRTSAYMGALFTRNNQAYLRDKLGREPTGGETYLAHFLGASGARKFIKAHDSNPQATAASLFPSAAASNHNVFYTKRGRARTVGEIYSSIGEEFNSSTPRPAAAQEAFGYPEAPVRNPIAQSAERTPDFNEATARASENTFERTPVETGDITVPPIIRGVDEAERAAKLMEHREQNAHGILESFGLGMQQSSLISWFFRNPADVLPNPEFDIGEERLSELVSKYPANYHDLFVSVSSEEQLRQTIKFIEDDMEAQKRLGNAGWGGTTAAIVGSVLSPDALAFILATEGAAAPWVFRAVTKAGRAVRGGLVGAGSGIAYEGLADVAGDPNVDTNSYLFAGTLGLALGAAFGPATLRLRDDAVEAITTNARDYHSANAPRTETVSEADVQTLDPSEVRVVDPEAPAPQTVVDDQTLAEFAGLTRDELVDLAKANDIPAADDMSDAQIRKALADAYKATPEEPPKRTPAPQAELAEAPATVKSDHPGARPLEDLKALPKKELKKLADDYGVPVKSKDTKAVIAANLRSQYAAERLQSANVRSLNPNRRSPSDDVTGAWDARPDDPVPSSTTVIESGGKPVKRSKASPREVLEGATTQRGLDDAFGELAPKLKAKDWKNLAKDVLGRSFSSGRFARENLHQHYSNQLLLDERLQQIERQFRRNDTSGSAVETNAPSGSQSFAQRVQEVANALTTPPFSRMTSIAQIYDEYGKHHADAGSLDDFKKRLLEANRNHDLELHPLDEPEALEAGLRNRSAIDVGHTRYHFVARNGEASSSVGAQQAQQPSRTFAPQRAQDIPDDSVAYTAFGGQGREGLERLKASRNPAIRAAANATGWFSENMRFDAVGQLKSSKNPLSRALGAALAEDAVGNADHSINRIGASERMDRLHKTWQAEFKRYQLPAYREWLKSEGHSGWFAAITKQSEFNGLVTRYIRARRPSERQAFPEPVRKFGDQVSRLFDEMRNLAANPGADEGLDLRAVGGFDNIPSDRYYAPRVADPQSIRNFVETYGDNTLVNMVRGAILSAQPNIDPSVLNRLARGYVRNIQDRAYGVDNSLEHAFLGYDEDALRQVLEDLQTLSDAEINDVIARTIPQDTDSGLTSVAKRRTLFDENFEYRHEMPNGNVVTLSPQMLFVEDVEQLFYFYSRQISGRISLAQTRLRHPIADELIDEGAMTPEEAYIVDGITKDADFERAVQDVRKTGGDLRLNAEEIESDVKNLRFIYNMITGRVDPAQLDRTAEWMRLVKKFNITNVLNQVGFAQLAEIPVTIGTMGVRAAMGHMPAFRRIVRDGEYVLNNGLDEEIEAAFGIGTDPLRGAYASRFDDHTGPMRAFEKGTSFSRVESGLDYANRATFFISGMAPITAGMQRWTAKVVAQKFANLAGNPTAANIRRMASLGIDEPMLNRILKEVRSNFDHQPGLFFDRQVKRLNLHKWEDLEARSAFEGALYRATRRMIQENDIGAMHRWMSNPMAQLILQFRTFMLGAYTKQLLHNIHMRDANTLAMFTMSAVVGGAVYTVQEHLRAIGKSDPQGYLNNRLTPEKIALAAFQRTGFSSVIPAMVDTVTFGLDGEPMFDFRTTSQPSDIIFGNPTTSLLADRGPAAIGGLVSPLLHGRAPTQTDTEAVRRVLPFGNFLPVMWTYNAMTQGLAERAPRGEEPLLLPTE